jgi:hypothetical protein
MAAVGALVIGPAPIGILGSAKAGGAVGASHAASLCRRSCAGVVEMRRDGLLFARSTFTVRAGVLAVAGYRPTRAAIRAMNAAVDYRVLVTETFSIAGKIVSVRRGQAMTESQPVVQSVLPYGALVRHTMVVFFSCTTKCTGVASLALGRTVVGSSPFAHRASGGTVAVSILVSRHAEDVVTRARDGSPFVADVVARGHAGVISQVMMLPAP